MDFCYTTALSEVQEFFDALLLPYQMIKVNGKSMGQRSLKIANLQLITR